MQGRRLEYVVMVSVNLFLTWTAVALRCYTRIFISRTFGSDDYWIILSLIGNTILSIIGFIAFHNGFGIHASELNFDQITTSLKCKVIGELTYLITAAAIKTSVGILLLRIISVKPLYKYIIWISLTIVWIWTIITFVITCVQCRPIQAAYDFTVPGNCMEPGIIANLAYAISAQTIFFDWLFALLPIPMLWNIKMSNQLKIPIIIILGLGIFASSATIIRFKYLIAFVHGKDSLYSIAPLFFWFTIEIALALVAASIATLRPLLRSWNIPGFASERSSDDEHRRPRFGTGEKKPPHRLTTKDSKMIQNLHNLHSSQDDIQFSNLQTLPSLSGRSDEAILGGGHGNEGGNVRAYGNGNESAGENDKYDLGSMPDGIMMKTEFKLEYGQRMSYMAKDDMV